MRSNQPKLQTQKNAFEGKWFLLAMLTGLMAGILAIAFQFLIRLVQHFTLNDISGYLPIPVDGANTYSDPPAAFHIWLIIPIVAAGGLLAGLIVYFFAPEAEGSGADGAIDAFHNKRGIIPLRVSIVKAFASAITLGTGGSAGREGPIAHICAGIGSFVGQRFGLSTHDRRIMLAIGMGAGAGAIFRAPLAGAIFAGEILYRDADIESEVIVPGALASVLAYSVFQLSLPQDEWFTPLFGDLSHYDVTHVAELIPYTILALALVLIAITYVRIFHFTQSIFSWLPIVPHLKPCVGAMIAGLLAVGSYFLISNDTNVLASLGSGYGFLRTAITDATAISILALLTVAGIKILTTSLTVGSGGSGGVFGPSMVIGGAIGAAFGRVFHHAVPGIVAQPSSFAIVGMAGFFAGVANAPFSTILMVTEITGSYQLLLPTLWVASICFILCRNNTLYSKQVGSRIDSPAHLGDFTVDLLAGILVRDAYRETDEGIVFHEQNTLDEIVHALARSTQRYFHVYNAEEELVGIFSSEDVRSYLFDESLWKIAIASDVMSERVVTLRLDDDLNFSLGQFTCLNVDELPVISSDNKHKVVGVLRRKETIALYNKKRLELQKQKDAERS